ncbi:MAG TPA: hypothetical protein VGD79_06605 [Thermoanaerobaculia bacterium]|jgi:hypothetical protein
MKKLLILVVAVALVIWVISWFRAPAAVATSAARTWPGTLGALDAVAARFPPQEPNAASVKLRELAKPLPQTEVVADYVGQEIARGELTIGEAPALTDVSAIRELLLHEPIVWRRTDGLGDDGDTQSRRGAQMRVARTLIASALTKARANDAAAWEDLHAAWNLARSLDTQPQMLVQTAAFSIPRMVNAVAWKMPLPVPAWFAELQQRDSVQPLLAGFQYQAASYWQDDNEMFPTKWLANSVEHDRLIATDVAKETRCDVHIRMNQLGVDLSSVWRRAFRYRAEREATGNALRVREGKPIEPASRCSDGTWAFDGTMLRFSREIASPPQDRAMPLVLRVWSAEAPPPLSNAR